MGTNEKKILPQFVIDSVMIEYNRHGGGKIDFSTIALIRNIITKNLRLYKDVFFSDNYLELSGLEKGHVVANLVNEFKINDFEIEPDGKNNFIYNNEKKNRHN